MRANDKTAVRPKPASEPVFWLSPREKQLLRRLAKGKTDPEIANEIGGTKRQIVEQRVRLFEMLGVRSQAQLVTAADQLAAWPARPKKVDPSTSGDGNIGRPGRPAIG